MKKLTKQERLPDAVSSITVPMKTSVEGQKVLVTIEKEEVLYPCVGDLLLKLQEAASNAGMEITAVSLRFQD